MILKDLAEAAAELHCTERWLADNLRSGRFPAQKIARKWVFSDHNISAILQICAVNHESAFSADSSVSLDFSRGWPG
jgi:hypothetical protein